MITTLLIFLSIKYRERHLQQNPKYFNIHYVNNKDEICHINKVTRLERDVIVQALKQTWLTSQGEFTAHNIHVEPIFEDKRK